MSVTSSNSNNPAGRVRALEAALKDSVLEVVWRQWNALDAHAAAGKPARSIVDPEALVLLSLSLIDDEKRLADLLHDWIIRNSDLISVQRIRNLARALPEPVGERLGWLASVAANEAKDPRWRSIPRGTDHPGVALQKLVRNGKARAGRARFLTAASLLVRLRSGLGVGAKTDTLAFLLGNDGDSARVREIAFATGYTIAAVRRACEDMATARLIRSHASGTAAYSADQAAWGRLLGLGATLPRWRNWFQKFEFVTAFRKLANDLRRETTPYALDVAIREVVAAHPQAFADEESGLESRYQEASEKTALAWKAVESFSSRIREEA